MPHSQAFWWETADKIVKTWQSYVSRMQNLETAIHWYFITKKKTWWCSKFLRTEERNAASFKHGQLITNYILLCSIFWVCAQAGKTISHDSIKQTCWKTTRLTCSKYRMVVKRGKRIQGRTMVVRRCKIKQHFRKHNLKKENTTFHKTQQNFRKQHFTSHNISETTSQNAACSLLNRTKVNQDQCQPKEVNIHQQCVWHYLDKTPTSFKFLWLFYGLKPYQNVIKFHQAVLGGKVLQLWALFKPMTGGLV